MLSISGFSSPFSETVIIEFKKEQSLNKTTLNKYRVTAQSKSVSHLRERSKFRGRRGWFVFEIQMEVPEHEPDGLDCARTL